MKSKATIAVLLLLALLAQLVPAGMVGAAGEEVVLKQVRLASWDIWLHADGKTWQHTGAPGDRRSYTFDVTPPEIAGVRITRFEMTAGVTQEQFMAAGGRAGYAATETRWDAFELEVLRHSPRNLRITDGSEVAFTLGPLSDAKEIKFEWQARLVEGWRFYLPAFIVWYGVRENLPDFAVSLTTGITQTEQGVPYTGTVTYRLKEAKGPTEAVLRITHNGAPLRTPAGEAIHGTVVTFNPGQTRAFEFRFTGQATNSQLRAEIWPTQPANRPERNRDARPQDNVAELNIPRQAAPRPPGGGDDCINDGPAPVAPPCEPAPQDSATVRHILRRTTFGIESLAFCANDSHREIISGDTVRGRFQFVSYQRDYYLVETLVQVDPGCPGWPGSPGCPVSGTPGDPGCPGWPPRYEWQPAGEISHRFRRDFNYTISASLSGTTITPSSGRHGSGRDSFTWRRTVGQTAQNNFTFTVTAPNGQTWTRTDACTIFLPRGIQVSPITTFSEDLHRGNRQVALFRVTNLRDVGEENVTLNFSITGGVFPGGATNKQESFTNDPRLVLPSGPVGATKGLLRAVEFYPTAGSTTLTVRALAAPLAVNRNPDNTRTLTSQNSRSWGIFAPIRSVDVPAFDNSRHDRTTANLPVTYHFTTNKTAREFTSGRFMDHRHGEIPYNIYTWSSRTENYTERLDVTVNIDSWQGRPEGHPRRGRGAWEIGWIFGEDAHRTIRAGTGFEVNVETRYSTNFASRAPNNHAGRRLSLNVEPEGPHHVMGAFPYANYRQAISRTNNHSFIQGQKGYRHGQETELEVKTGRRGDHNISWRMPLRSHTGDSGRVHSSYTHYVTRWFPDAYPDRFLATITNYMRRNNAQVEARIRFDDRYRFTVVTGPAGVSNLLELHEDYVFVFGHIFRDIYSARPRD